MSGVGDFVIGSLALGGSIVSPVEKISFKVYMYVYMQTNTYYKFF